MMLLNFFLSKKQKELNAICPIIRLQYCGHLNEKFLTSSSHLSRFGKRYSDITNKKIFEIFFMDPSW